MGATLSVHLVVDSESRKSSDATYLDFRIDESNREDLIKELQLIKAKYNVK